MKNLAIIILLSIISTPLLAQETDWYVNFENIMDNREYDRSVGNPQTILGARLNFAVGLKQDSISGMYAGINYMYEYGGTLDSITPAINLYYEINRKDFAFYAGSFPKDKIIDFPLFMFGDSLNYYTPNMGGMAFEFRRNWGKQNIFVDWTGRQSPTTREAFIAGFSGKYKRDMFYIENFGYMYHFALTEGYKEDEHIRDNGVGAVYLGIDLAKKTPLDILKFDMGGVGCYDRNRPADFIVNGGIMGRLNAHYKRVGVDITAYIGEAMSIPLGDQLYTNGNYTRTDLCFTPLKGDHIESVFKCSFHTTGGTTSMSQQFFLIAKF